MNKLQDNTISILIIGASYGGLSLANYLNLYNVKFKILDALSAPSSYGKIEGMLKIPSIETVFESLKLEWKKIIKLDGNNNVSQQLLIELLRENLNIDYGKKVVEITKQNNELYIQYIEQAFTKKKFTRKKLGPFHMIIGADGILSVCRKFNDKQIALIGDANDTKWYDFGFTRVQSGADSALKDGIQVGEIMVNILLDKKKKHNEIVKTELIKALQNYSASKIRKTLFFQQLLFWLFASIIINLFFYDYYQILLFFKSFKF